MQTISKLYDILRKRGLTEGDIQQFITIIEDYLLKGLVTKNDLKATEDCIKKELATLELDPIENIKDVEKEVKNTCARLKEEIANLESNLKNTERRLNENIAGIEARLFRWMVTLIIVQASIIIAALKLL